MPSRLLMLALLLAAPRFAAANPCNTAMTAGRNVLPGGPLPLISIARETISIIADMEPSGDDTPPDPVAIARENALHPDDVLIPLDEARALIQKTRFTIDYVFKNSGKPVAVTLGFPIGGAWMPDSKPQPLSSFRVTGDGFIARVRLDPRSLESLRANSFMGRPCENPNPLMKVTHEVVDGNLMETMRDDEGNVDHVIGWYFWRQRFRAGESKLRVQYVQDEHADPCHISYALGTSRFWGSGEIGKLRISFVQQGQWPYQPFTAFLPREPLPAAKQLAGEKDRYLLAPSRINQAQRRMIWELKGVRPQGTLFLEIRGCPPMG